MSQKVGILRSLVEQRLTLAAEEIFGLFERTIAEYEEELFRTKEENHRQRQILDTWKQRDSIHKTDVQQLSVVKADVPPEQQEWNPTVDQEEPEAEPPHIKEEQEELWTSQEVNITKFPSTPVPVKSEDDDDDDDDEEKVKSSQLNQSQTEENKEEANKVDCGGSEASSSFHPHRHLQRKSDEQNEDCEETVLMQETHSPTHTVTMENYLTLSNGGYEKKLFSCSVCPKTFCWKSHLEMHMMSHTGEKPFRCLLCHKCFAHKSNAKRHMKVHTGERPFNCSVCGKTFTCNSDLTCHMRCHTGEKPYGCVVCQKSFTRKHHLQMHMKTHIRQ